MVAGAVVAVRQTSKLSLASLKAPLQRTARDIDGKGFDGDFDYGIIDLAALKGSPDASKAPAKKAPRSAKGKAKKKGSTAKKKAKRG